MKLIKHSMPETLQRPLTAGNGYRQRQDVHPDLLVRLQQQGMPKSIQRYDDVLLWAIGKLERAK
jgi:hypothetical protein